MTESPTVRVQLLLARSLFNRARVALETGDDVSLMTSVLLFDVAVETLTKAACHEREIHVKSNHSLQELLPLLKEKVPRVPQAFTSARFVREQRNAIQHAGVGLSSAACGRLATESGAYLRAITREVFSEDFDTISPVRLIRDPRLRELLEDAESSRDAGDLDLALATGCAAFEMMRCRWERSVGYADEFDDDRADAVPPMNSFLLCHMAHRYDDREFDVVVPELEDDRYRPLSRLTLGLTLNEFRRLRSLVRRCEERIRESKPIDATREDVDFVISTVSSHVWRIESVHPDAITSSTLPRPFVEEPAAPTTDEASPESTPTEPGNEGGS